MSELPLMRSLTYKEIYAIYAEGNLGKYSMGYLEKVGWATNGVLNYPLGLDNDGDIVWLPGANGVMPVIEASGATILAALMSGANSLATLTDGIKTIMDDVYDNTNHCLNVNDVVP